MNSWPVGVLGATCPVIRLIRIWRGPCFQDWTPGPLSESSFWERLREYNRAMITRRDTLAGAIALLCQLGAAHAQPQNETTSPQSKPGADPIFKHDLPNISMEDWEVTVSYVDYPPGRVGRTHHHAGFVLAYVLEGAIVTKISGQEQRTYRTGEMFFEPPGSTHEVSNNASATEPAKLLAMIFAKKGVQLTTPGPA